ncbi:MAG: Ig-like domain-containing protein [Fibrobacterota bacterium]
MAVARFTPQAPDVKPGQVILPETLTVASPETRELFPGLLSAIREHCRGLLSGLRETFSSPRESAIAIADAVNAVRARLYLPALGLMAALALFLAACGPGNVVDPVDDDDAIADDDTVPDDDDDADDDTGPFCPPDPAALIQEPVNPEDPDTDFTVPEGDGSAGRGGTSIHVPSGAWNEPVCLRVTVAISAIDLPEGTQIPLAGIDVTPTNAAGEELSAQKDIEIHLPGHRGKVWTDHEGALAAVPVSFSPAGTKAATRRFSPFFLGSSAPAVERADVQKSAGRQVTIDLSVLDEGSRSLHLLDVSLTGPGGDIAILTRDPETGALQFQANLPAGTHTLLARVIDPYGQEGTLEIPLVIDPCEDVTCEDPEEACDPLDGVCRDPDGPCEPTPCENDAPCSVTPEGTAACACDTAHTGDTCANCAAGRMGEDCHVPVPTGVEVSGPATVLVGETRKFTAQVLMEDGSVHGDCDWTATGGIGTVDSEGDFTATAPGTGTVICTAGEISDSSPVITENPDVLGPDAPVPTQTDLEIGPAAAFFNITLTPSSDTVSVNVYKGGTLHEGAHPVTGGTPFTYTVSAFPAVAGAGPSAAEDLAGVWTFRGLDNAGNQGAPATVRVTVDTVPPGAPAVELADEPAGTTSVTVGPDYSSPVVSGLLPNPADTKAVFAVNSSGTEFPVSSYTEGDDHFSHSLPLASGTWTFAAEDRFGTRSAASAPLTVILDDTPPPAPSVGPGYETVQINIDQTEVPVPVTVSADTVTVLVYGTVTNPETGNPEQVLLDSVSVADQSPVDNGDGTLSFNLTLSRDDGTPPAGTHRLTAVDGVENESENAGTVDVEYAAPSLGDASFNSEIFGSLIVAGGFEYDVIIPATNAETFSVTIERLNGEPYYLPGTVTPESGVVDEDGNIKFVYRSGDTGGLQVRMTVEATGPGGTDIMVTEFILE